MSEKLLLTVTGNIGAGATTLAKRILGQRCDYVDSCTIDATVANPYLADFYYEPEKWSFHNQVGALICSISRYRKVAAQIERAHASVYIQDKAIEEHNSVFAKALQIEGTLQLRDVQVLEALFDAARVELPCRQAMIGIDTPPEVLLGRIRVRGRLGEVRVSADHLEKLDGLFRHFFANWPGPVLTVHGGRRDLRSDSIDDVLDWIREVQSRA